MEGNYPAAKAGPRSIQNECFAGLALPREHTLFKAIGSKRLLDRFMGEGVNCNNIILLVESKTSVGCKTRQLASISSPLLVWQVLLVCASCLRPRACALFFLFPKVPHDTYKVLLTGCMSEIWRMRECMSPRIEEVPRTKLGDE